MGLTLTCDYAMISKQEVLRNHERRCGRHGEVLTELWKAVSPLVLENRKVK